MPRRRLPASVLVVVLLYSGVASALDDPMAMTRSRRAGFTMELGIGGGATFLFEREFDIGRNSTTGQDFSRSYYDVEPRGGIAPLSLGIGGFLTENVALMFRASGTTFFDYGGVGANLFYGAAVQIWTSDALMFGAGVGLGAFASDIEQGVNELGVATSLRVSYAVFARREHAFSVGVELVPSFFPDDQDFALGTALIAGWQLF